ncbi:isoquinoline 1-oxidoreductase beta subunit [Nocardioides luteus]|uniref:Isoquinoline 1-oxidoreductase subunit beta n=1 Tax=Nocardioides luteus TaxID=1844 RepID=A0ABQ5T1V2_9ACTN|nr:molybdopterin cofactor-binding domain-containing protein [Nocardioides luteus]MDR7310756.1 isoquinoline 1-oxidoreductase beta subunit [Nocardioides luteus]GGR40805.1 isoquinoline 1-oxidoreductase subunit beta [Nocardioides luteus]GLJ69464.1 isoquinoline 1-oxidoreductase subunit beta [Nocardioides luteus]
MENHPTEGPSRVSRRSFVGYVIGGATLIAAADLGLTPEAAHAAPIPSVPQVPEVYDLNDFLTHCTLPTSNLIAIEIDEKGHAHFALPRMEVGQGITTAIAMLIAEELDLPVDHVHVTLAPARPELLFNQLTGGSNSMISMYTPVRVAAAIARKSLLEAAAILLGTNVAQLVAKGGVIGLPDGSSVTYGEAAAKAAKPKTEKVEVKLKKTSDHKVIGKPHRRIDALEAVTGKKQFAMDVDVPGALPTMVCRAPELNGTAHSINNKGEVLKMPGVTHVAIIPTGVAVRAKTFGQCIDAVRALDVTWNSGTVTTKSAKDIKAELKAGQIPLAVPKIGATSVDGEFTFHFRSGSSLEPNCAVADVRDGKATIWGGLKSPVTAQEKIAAALGMLPTDVTVNVVQGGGSFGRKLFFDAALEAAHASKAFKVPVKLMWHRADEPRQGRVHPMAVSRVRATVLAGGVLTFEQRHSSVATDFTHGLGERITAEAAALPTGLSNLTFSETIFMLATELPYNFGVVTQLLNEPKPAVDRFNTSSVRNIYSPDVATASELMVDQLAEKLKLDPVSFRRKYLKSDTVRRVLDRAAEIGGWGKKMPAGTAQGIAIHKEYKGATAVLVEIDCRPETVNREVRDAVTGPRVTKAVVVADVGLVINPAGVKAQMMGGFSDGMCQALTYSNHLVDGHFLEASWDNSAYTRQWNTPFEFECEVMESHGSQPGGVGEAGVAASMAAVACAYARATGEMPTEFPINFHEPLHFEPKSFIPSVPESPTDGLAYTF